MAASKTAFWNIWLLCDDASAGAFADALGPFGLSVARFEQESDVDFGGDTDPGPRLWRITALADKEPDRAGIMAALALAADRAGAPLPEIHIDKLEGVDWLALNRRQFPPLNAAGFFIHGSHFEGEIPQDKIAICLDAGPAFGSGTHESTQGCLMAITEIMDQERFERPLDLGCGSGILTLALASLTGVKVLASDLDKAAVETVTFNAKANGLARSIEAVLCDGVGEAVRAQAPFDLVVANILAEPLIEMAPDLGEVVSPGGTLVLAGLLSVQEGDVMAAYEAAGFIRLKNICLGKWCTLITRRGPGG
jgi:ribosomal protein L11 methyltransferase